MSRRSIGPGVLAFACLGVAGLLALVFHSKRLARLDATSPAAPIAIQGQPAPDFTLRAMDGRTVKLSDLHGRPVLLNFWATWCTPCRIEMPWLVELYRAYHSQGIEFVGVSLDDSGHPHAVTDYARNMDVAYPVLFGTSAVADSYGSVRLMPQTFFISADGTLLDSTIGISSKDDLEAHVRGLLATSAPAR